MFAYDPEDKTVIGVWEYTMYNLKRDLKTNFDLDYVSLTPEQQQRILKHFMHRIDTYLGIVISGNFSDLLEHVLEEAGVLQTEPTSTTRSEPAPEVPLSSIVAEEEDVELVSLEDDDEDAEELRKITPSDITNTDLSRDGAIRDDFDADDHYDWRYAYICHYCGDEFPADDRDLFEHLVETHPRRLILAYRRSQAQMKQKWQQHQDS